MDVSARPAWLALALVATACTTSPFSGQSAWTNLPDVATADTLPTDATPTNATGPDVATFRDWHLYPAIAVRPQPADVWFLGDVHGDYIRLGSLLQGAGLLDNSKNWQAGAATLVCTGDLIDKGNDALDTIALLQALAPQAAAANRRPPDPHRTCALPRARPRPRSAAAGP